MRVLSGKSAERAVGQLEQRASRLDEVKPAVRRIVQAVRRGGDKAVTRYATLWDGLQEGQSLQVSPAEIEQAWKATPTDTREALKRAATNIRRFANWQVPRSWSRKISGGELGQIVRPLESVGCYVPGGRYPLPSTLLMTADSSAGRRRRTHRGGVAQCAACNAGRRISTGHNRGLPLRWSAGDCGFGVRN